MQVVFLEGVLPERNKAIIHELHGHVSYMSRQPNTKEGEKGMTLLSDQRVVIAEGFNDVYDVARGFHRLRARRTNPG